MLVSMQMRRTEEEIGKLISKLKPVRKGLMKAQREKPETVPLHQWRRGLEQGAYFLGYTQKELCEMFNATRVENVRMEGVETREQLAKFVADKVRDEGVPLAEAALILGLHPKSPNLERRAADAGIYPEIYVRGSRSFTVEQFNEVKKLYQAE
jgi:hypothetical protein